MIKLPIMIEISFYTLLARPVNPLFRSLYEFECYIKLLSKVCPFYAILTQCNILVVGVLCTLPKHCIQDINNTASSVPGSKESLLSNNSDFHLYNIDMECLLIKQVEGREPIYC